MRPVKEPTAKEENFRTELIAGGAFEAIRRDFVEPEPVGTIILMAFRITGYDKDCDGGAMVRAEHITKSGSITGWDISHIGLYDDSALVISAEELPELFNS